MRVTLDAMHYIEAFEKITSKLDHDTSDKPVRAGLRLALLAWRHDDDPDPAWDRATLAVLAAEELLRPYVPDTTAPCQPPTPGDMTVPPAVVRLLRALTVRLERSVDDAARPLPERLARHVAAQQLDQAAALLT